MAAPFAHQLVSVANALSTPGKGILAADEGPALMGSSRFKGIGVENSFENRRDYRELLFSTVGIEQYVSGVILEEEMLFSDTVAGTPLHEILKSKGIVPGAKVDIGAIPMAGGADGDIFTQGLDGLGQKLDKYVKRGAQFSKWHAWYQIKGDAAPSSMAVAVNARTLGMFAALSQERGLVPLVEAELMMDGDHTIEKAAEVMENIMAEVIYQLLLYKVLLEGVVLKPNMVTPGSSCTTTYSPADIGRWTARVLTRSVPIAVPGILFLSGGQSEDEATENLYQINLHKPQSARTQIWSLSFCYSRALQQTVLKAWGGKKENTERAQQAFLQRAKANSLAAQGISV